MTRRLIEKSIREVIDNHEPRARIEDVQVFDEPDTNTYRVRIFFYVVNFTGSGVFEAFLVRTR